MRDILYILCACITFKGWFDVTMKAAIGIDGWEGVRG